MIHRRASLRAQPLSAGLVSLGWIFLLFAAAHPLAADPDFFSDPNRPHGQAWEEYQALLSPPESFPAVPPRLPSYHITREGDKLIVEHERVRDAERLDLPYKIVRRRLADLAAPREGLPPIEWIGVRMPVPGGVDPARPTPILEGMELDGSSLSPSDPRIWPRRRDMLLFQGNWPILGINTVPEFSHVSRATKLFDPVTGWRIVPESGRASVNSERFTFTPPMHTYRPGPAVLMFDAASCPCDEVVLDAREGEIASFPWGEVRLGAIAELPFAGNGAATVSGDGLSSDVLSFKLALPDGKPGSPAGNLISSAYLSRSVAHAAIPIYAGAETKSGEIAESESRIVTGTYVVYSFPFEAKDIVRFHLRSPRSLRRYVVEMPPLPGLPPENANIENLFDVVIPYIDLRERGAWNLIELIEENAQMPILWEGVKDRRHSVPPRPKDLPETLENVTVGDLLRLYLKALGNVKARIDQDDSTIRLSWIKQPDVAPENWAR